jgi:large subunit ribosomal protein MRP49
MRRDPRYRKIGELWRMVHGQPFVALRSPAFELPVDDLPALYEQWCLLEVAHCLCSMGDLVEQQLLDVEEHDDMGGPRVAWRIRLLQDRPLLRIRRTSGEQLTLSYQRRFRPQEGHHRRGFGSLDPFLRVPDIVVELSRPGQWPALLVFDAKYRVAADGGIPEEALGDAYTYHAALGYGGHQVCHGVFLLFPGTVGFEQGTVGALPLLPRQTASLRTILDRFLLHPVE